MTQQQQQPEVHFSPSDTKCKAAAGADGWLPGRPCRSSINLSPLKVQCTSSSSRQSSCFYCEEVEECSSPYSASKGCSTTSFGDDSAHDYDNEYYLCCTSSSLPAASDASYDVNGNIIASWPLQRRSVKSYAVRFQRVAAQRAAALSQANGTRRLNRNSLPSPLRVVAMTESISTASFLRAAFLDGLRPKIRAHLAWRIEPGMTWEQVEGLAESIDLPPLPPSSSRCSSVASVCCRGLFPGTHQQQ